MKSTSESLSICFELVKKLGRQTIPLAHLVVPDDDGEEGPSFNSPYPEGCGSMVKREKVLIAHVVLQFEFLTASSPNDSVRALQTATPQIDIVTLVRRFDQC